MRLGTIKRHFVEGQHSLRLNSEVSHAKLSGHGWQQWRVDRAEAEEAVGKEVTGVEATATVLAVNTGAEGEEASTAAGAKEITTAVVDAGEAPMQRSSITGWESMEAALMSRSTKPHRKNTLIL